MDALNSKAKQALFLWLEGFREACCLHRVVILCLRSRMLLFRIGECFLLNGLIFLGSIFILHSVIIPILHWILPDQCQLDSKDMSSFGMIVKIHSFLRVALLQLFYVFWFYPLYIFSMVLSGLWYNDIAKYGFIAMGKPKPSITDQSNQEELVNMQNPSHVDKPAGLGGIIIGIGEQVYSVLLLSFFFLEVYAAGFVPYIGKILNFLLLSWIYAYYCFEYKWNLSGLPLDKRLDFFESNWAFFAGFGSPCVLAIFFFTPLVSYGVMAVLFPLFVLSATCSEAEQVINSQRRAWKGAGLGRLPVFYAADTLSMWILSLFSNRSQGRLRDEKLL